MDKEKVKTLSKLIFTNKESFSSTKIKLYKLQKFILTTNCQELVNCAFNKLFEVFINKNKYIKKECITIFKKINKRIENIDNVSIIRMFYLNDFEIHKLLLKFIFVFYRYFKNDEIALFYVMKSRHKYKHRILNKFHYRLKLICRKNIISNYDQNSKILEYTKSLKNKKLNKFFKKHYTKKLNDDDFFKYKYILDFFLNNHYANENYCYDIKECKIDSEIVCKINGFNDDILFKKLEKYFTKHKQNI